MKPSPEKPNTLEFKKDIPYIRKGLSLDQVWFSGGRTGMTMLRHGGIGEILYFGRQVLTGAMLFKAGTPQSSWEKLFRLCIVIDGVAFYPEFNHTRIYPFGYVSECTLGGVRFQHELQLLNDALVQRVKILSNPGEKNLSLKLLFHGHNRATSSHRTWTEWELDEKLDGVCAVATDVVSEEECREAVEKSKKDVRAHFGISDTPYGETHLAIAAHGKVSMQSARNGFKYYVTTETFKTDAAFFIAFSSEQSGLEQRVRELKGSFGKECDDQLARFKQRLAESPKIQISGEEVVQSCLNNIPAVIDALEVKDVPGGYRAGMHPYWIWLDLLADTSGFLYANDASSLRDLLLLNKKFADSRLGIPCLVTAQFKPLIGVPFHTQCTFNVALYQYYCHTGDIATLRECYPLTKWIIDKCLEQEICGSGLIEGAGLPDHPASQNGHDISAAGNSVFYQALKVMRYLAEELSAATPNKEYGEFASLCEVTAARCRDSFVRCFYDEEKGYFVDSLSSVDFSKRHHYPIVCIQWITPFAADLLGKHGNRIADFVANNFNQPHGPRMFPSWDTALPGDGNQLYAYYPSWSEAFYRSVLKQAGLKKELARWYDVVDWFWQRNTIPEGFTYDAENEGFTPDNPGSKQGFGAQAWYSVFFRCMIGFEVDERGLIITPSALRKEISVKDMVIRGKKIDITVSGKGTEIVFNGEKLKGPTAIIPFSELQSKNTLVLQ